MLTLKIILLVKLTFVDCTPCLGSSSHTIARSRVYIQMQDITWSKDPIIDSLLWSLLIYNYFVTIIQMLLGLVREHTLQWFHFEFRARRLDVSCHHLVGVFWLYRSCCRLESIPRSQNNISLLSLGFSANYERMRT